MKVITASSEHIDTIVGHRIEMFRSMGWTDEELENTRPVVQRFLQEHWDHNLRAYLAVVDGEVIGGYAIGLGVSLPTYKNPSGRRASIHNLYV
ncbi:MAG: hypothetical protein JSW61_06240, partial [Candidatus Thorarchaeota archaeon]